MRSFQAEVCSANLLRGARSSPAAGFAAFIDWQTLVTHNHTIICGSLREGLTSRPCARHAQAYCHKKTSFKEGSALKLVLLLAALNFYSLKGARIFRLSSDFVSLLYIAKKISVRVAIVLIKIRPEIAQSRFCPI